MDGGRITRRSLLAASGAGAAAVLVGGRVVLAQPGVFDVDSSDPAIAYILGEQWIRLTGHPGRSNGTVTYSHTKGAVFSYTHPACTQIKWLATKNATMGKANVYLNGVLKGTVNLYSANVVHGQVIFDTGQLSKGSHTLKVELIEDSNVELDRLQVSAESMIPVRINDDNTSPLLDNSTDFAGGQGLITYYGSWTAKALPSAVGGDVHQSAKKGSSADMSFRGASVAWLGSKGPGHGRADVFVDGVLRGTVDCYSSAPLAAVSLFKVAGLDASKVHTIRIQVRHERDPRSTGHLVDVDAFDVDIPLDVQMEMEAEAQAEINQIKAGTKSYLQPSTWQKVSYAALVPEKGVQLLNRDYGAPGPLKTAFDTNINYLNYCFGKTAAKALGSQFEPKYVEYDSFWSQNWPSSTEGRMLHGAGHSLRWLTTTDSRRDSLNTIVSTIVNAIKVRQASNGNGYAARLPEAEFPDVNATERANYDRAMFVRGLIAAGMGGNRDAYPILRGYSNWFNTWLANRLNDPSKPKALLEMSLGMQGHIASTMTYFTPVGQSADMVSAERAYVQDWWLKRLANREPQAVSHYPLDRPHSYLLIAGECYLDHYRATGAQKYLDAALGIWDIFREGFLFTGGGTSISEHRPYPHRSHRLDTANNELDGAIFWALMNSRLLQLFPDQEKYATEIERAIYNTLLANQVPGTGSIRYHAMLHYIKENGTVINTCCEIMGTGMYGRLPEFLYSVASDGLWINMYESSTITWNQGSATLTLSTSTRFPESMEVMHTVTVPKRMAFKIRTRVPSWATSNMQIRVNGSVVADSAPGSYATVDRYWSSGDTITYTLPAGWRLTRYDGFQQVDGQKRYALENGPILYTLAGGDYTLEPVPVLDIAPDALTGALKPVGTPLEYKVGADTVHTFRPYWRHTGGPMSVFPIVKGVSRSGGVVAWGSNNDGQVEVPSAAGLGVVSVSGGPAHSLALTDSGKVLAWGARGAVGTFNNAGQCVVPESALSAVVAVAAGGYHSLAVKSGGTVVAWGHNGWGQAAVPAGLSGVASVAAGTWHSLALKSDGTVVAWGQNSYGQTSVPEGLQEVVQVAATGFASYALKRDGTVVMWGWANPLRAGISGVVSITAGFTHALGLKSDGTVIALEDPNDSWAIVPVGLADVVAIAAGGGFSAALRSSGSVIMWGMGAQGQTQVPPMASTPIGIAAGRWHMLAITAQ